MTMDYTDFVVNCAQHMRPLEYDLSENHNLLVRYLHDMGVLDNVPVGTLGPATVLSASDALAAPLRSLVVGGSSVQDGTPTPSAPVAIQSVAPDSQGNISLWARGRNLLPPGLETVTGIGVTITRNADGSYTLSGTATTTGDLRFVADWEGLVKLRKGVTYAFKALYQTKAGVRVTARADRLGTTAPLKYLNDTGDAAVTYTPTEDGIGITVCYVNVTSGTNVNGLTIYPMLYEGTTTESFQPYTSTVTPVPLDGHELRSLPDGTKDELNLSYLRPSTREGWAWYSRELVRRTGFVSADTLVAASKTIVELADVVRISYANVLRDEPSRQYDGDPAGSGWCNVAPYVNDYTQNAVHAYAHNAYTYVFAPKADKSAWNATTATEWTNEHALELVYALATPVTHDLGEIELQSIVGPSVTIWATADATPTLTAQYVRDIGAAINDMQEAIADL